MKVITKMIKLPITTCSFFPAIYRTQLFHSWMRNSGIDSRAIAVNFINTGRWNIFISFKVCLTNSLENKNR